MAVKVDRFLLQWFMQLHFNEMPPEKRKTFIKYINGGDDFPDNSDMKIWKRDLIHQVGDKWVNNDLPDGRAPSTALPHIPTPNPWEMDDEEWKKLYIEFRNALRQMQANRSKFSDPADPDTYNPDATAFLHDNFGDPTNKLFSNVIASPDAETEIAKLLGFLNDPAKSSAFSVKLREWGIISASDLRSGITSKQYNTDVEFQNKLKEVSEYLQYYSDELGITGCDFEKIRDGFDEKHVDATKLAEFKDRHRDLLQIVAKNKKIQEQFQSDKIKTALETANKKTSYDDKSTPNFLVDSKNDLLTPLQRFQEWKQETYSDVFEKYKMLQGDRLYFSPQASNIVAALDKEKVKPTDGLDGIAKAAGNVENALLKKSASAARHFKWLSKTLEDIKGIMPKSYEGALRNGAQLNHVIEELIIRAVRDNKIDEAKTAMEVISVCKYGLTTSKIMDKLKNEKVTILSDPKLSFNKNEFAKQFGVVFDKTLETMLKGVGYTITAIGNTINKSGSKFKGASDRLHADAQAWQTQNAADKAAAEADRNAKNLIDETERRNQETRRNATGITDATLAAHESRLAIGKQTEERLKGQYEAAEADYQAKEQQKQQYEADIQKYGTDVPQKIADLATESARLRTQYTQIQAQLRAIPTPYTNAMDELKARQLQAQYNQLYDQRKQKLQERRTLQAELNTAKAPGGKYAEAMANIANARAEATRAEAVRNRENHYYTTEQALNYDRSDKIKTFKDSRQKIQELTTQIDRRNKIISEWDDKHINQWNELRDFWNYLETGRDSRTGDFYNRLKFSKKHAQQDFDADKIALFMEYKRHNTIAA